MREKIKPTNKKKQIVELGNKMFNITISTILNVFILLIITIVEKLKCLILNPINIREKVEICERNKKKKKNLPNVGGENAANVAGKKSGKGVNNSVESHSHSINGLIQNREKRLFLISSCTSVLK